MMAIAATFVFLYSGDIAHINTSTSVGVNPRMRRARQALQRMTSF